MAKNKPEPFSAVIHNQEGLARVMGYMSGITPTVETPYTIRVAQADESRSLKQNRRSFMWYQLRGSMTGHGQIHERCLCKLKYGVPILRRDDEDFEKFWHSALQFIAYESQLEAMEFVPVTSLMGMKQFAEYLTEVDQQSASQGIVLPHPEDLYWDALMKEADHERS